MRDMSPHGRPRRLLLMALMVLLGCGRPAARQTSVEERPKGHAIGVLLASLDSPWRVQMKADIEAAAAKHPDLRLIVMDAQNDAAKQRAQLDELADSHVEVVIVSPKDVQAITDPLARLFDAGTAVIVLDRAVIGDKYTCFIAADPTEIGAAAGKWLARRLQGKGKIVELRGPVDSLWAEAVAHRMAGRAARSRLPLRVRRTRRSAEGRWRQADGRGAWPGQTDRRGVRLRRRGRYAAYQAAKTAGREKGVLFVGVGGLPEQGAAYVSKGILAATFLNPTGGAEAVDVAVKLLHGEKVPKKIVPPTREFTREVSTIAPSFPRSALAPSPTLRVSHPRSHAPRGNALADAPRPWRSEFPMDDRLQSPRRGASHHVRSHAERGNEMSEVCRWSKTNQPNQLSGASRSATT